MSDQSVFILARSQEDKLSFLAEHNLQEMFSEVQDLETQLRAAMPDALDFIVRWHIDSATKETPRIVHVELSSPAKKIRVMAGLSDPAHTPRTLIAGYLELTDDFQKQGLGTETANKLFTFARERSFPMVKTVANISLGSYVWARFGARPQNPTTVRKRLEIRIDRLLKEGIWTEEIAKKFRKRLQIEDPDFMLTLSGYSESGRDYGKELLSSEKIGEWDWDAYWDLRNNFQSMILERRWKNR